MKISKILIAALILICAIGIVSAAELPNLQVPDTFKDLGGGSYSNEADNIEIDIFNDTDLKSYFTNDTATKLTVTPGKINNTYTYTDGTNKQFGVSELVKINGEQYVIQFWADDDSSNTSLDRFYDALEQVNKLNNITPEDASTL
jgi:hypothetical protein